MVHGDTRTAPITPGSRSKNTARGTYLPPEALAVKYIDAAELRVVVAAVLAVAADTVLVAQHLLKLGAHLATALARLHVLNLARKSSLEARSKREKGRGGAEKRKKLRAVVWHGKQEMQVARARVSRAEK
jgi:hypothetical protein